MSKVRKRTLDLAAYAGRWVVLSDDRVLAAGVSLSDAMRKLPARKPGRTSSVFLVPRQDEGPYVLVIPLRRC